MISGATVIDVQRISQSIDSTRTPIWGACHIILNLLQGFRMQIQGDSEVRQLDIAVLGRENVRSLEVAVHHMGCMQVM